MFSEVACQAELVKGALTEAECDINRPCTSDLLRTCMTCPPPSDCEKHLSKTLLISINAWTGR